MFKANGTLPGIMALMSETNVYEYPLWMAQSHDKSERYRVSGLSLTISIIPILIINMIEKYLNRRLKRRSFPKWKMCSPWIIEKLPRL